LLRGIETVIRQSQIKGDIKLAVAAATAALLLGDNDSRPPHGEAFVLSEHNPEIEF
jgi:hypothetical protein